MIFVWTTSNKIGSKLIRWGSNSECSHFAVVFDEDPMGYGVVFHSQLFGGVKLDWWNGFKKNHTVVHALKPKKPLGMGEEEIIYQTIVSRFYGEDYDRAALMYWAGVILRHKMFGTPIPEVNLADSPHKEMCTELGRGIADIPWLQIPKVEDYAMILPHHMYEIFEQSPMLENAYDFLE